MNTAFTFVCAATGHVNGISRSIKLASHVQCFETNLLTITFEEHCIPNLYHTFYRTLMPHLRLNNPVRLGLAGKLGNFFTGFFGRLAFFAAVLLVRNPDRVGCAT